MSTHQDKEQELRQAARGGNTRRIHQLLQENTNVNCADSDGCTPLYNAACGGRIGIIKTLLDAGAKVDAVVNCGYTPLLIAAYYGNTECVKALLDAGANIDKVNQNGDTPLIYVARYGGNTECVKALLDAGANIDMVNQEGYTAETWATNNGYDEIAELLKRAHLQGCKEKKKKEKKPAHDLEEEFTCPICMELAEKAVETSCCHQVFCDECLAKVRNNTCPQCRSQFTTIVSHVARRVIGNMPADCIYNCDANITKSELEAHTENCPKKLYACPAPNCTFNGDQNAFANHLLAAHKDTLIRNASKLF